MSDPTPLTPEILIPRLGDVLVEKKLITAEQLETTLAHQARLRTQGRFIPVGQLLVELGFIDRTRLDEAVTEQIIALRAALQDANYHLERRVEQRTRELQQALARLAELNQLKSNFIANVSHELRTPLTHIRGYLDLLGASELGALNPDQKMAVDVMQRSSERLERLIDDLILFSTTEQGDLNLDIRTYNLSRSCVSILKRMQVKAEEKGISLQFDRGETEIFVEADEDKINWVLIQLIDNAIKFSKPGSTVTLNLALQDGFVHVAVVDFGIGIPAGRIDEIFTAFHQLDSSSTRRFGGTGLGLALAQRIIEAHGTVITVTSQEGKGSTFEFILKQGSIG